MVLQAPQNQICKVLQAKLKTPGCQDFLVLEALGELHFVKLKILCGVVFTPLFKH